MHTFFLLFFLFRRFLSLFPDDGETSEVRFGLVRLPRQVHLHVALLRLLLLDLLSVPGAQNISCVETTKQ